MPGWTVTYIIDERGGGPSAGYIASGFWGGKQRVHIMYFTSNEDSGLTVGRLALLWVNKKVYNRSFCFFFSKLTSK